MAGGAYGERAMEPCPRLVLTGAAGFVGRRLIEALSGCWRVEAIDHHPPPREVRLGRPGVRWHALDVAEREPLARLFDELARDGGATALVHLAAHYDFTGERHPEYERTNVRGTRLVLELARRLNLERFVFASSVAACDFPPPGKALDETSPPDGRHVYAESKHAGEEMMRFESETIPTAIVRFAALFSDWCEYAPLDRFLDTWLGRRWDARILGGRGESAVPYLHVRDACLFLQRVLERRRELAPAEVLIASPNGATSHEDLYRAATAWAFGRVPRPLKVPRPLAAVGIVARDLLGRALGRRPFERAWMAAMIDKRLTVDASRTHLRLGWWPRPRLELLHRLPFLLENRRSEPGAWRAANEATLHGLRLAPPLEVLRRLEEEEETIFAAMTETLLGDPARWPHYATFSRAEHDWNHRLLVRALAQSVRARDRTSFRTYCHDLARRRAEQGVTEPELRGALQAFERICSARLDRGARDPQLAAAVRDLVSGTIEFGLDGVEEAYEELGAAAPGAAAERLRAR